MIRTSEWRQQGAPMQSLARGYMPSVSQAKLRWQKTGAVHVKAWTISQKDVPTKAWSSHGQLALRLRLGAPPYRHCRHEYSGTWLHTNSSHYTSPSVVTASKDLPVCYWPKVTTDSLRGVKFMCRLLPIRLTWLSPKIGSNQWHS